METCDEGRWTREEVAQRFMVSVGMPEKFSNRHTIYTRMNRWSKSGVWDRVFERLQKEGLLHLELRVVSLDGTSAKVHPDGTGAEKKRAAGHRQLARRLEHQDSSGCRE